MGVKNMLKIKDLEINKPVKDIFLKCVKLVSEGQTPEGFNFASALCMDENKDEIELTVWDNEKNKNCNKLKMFVGKQFQLCNGYCKERDNKKILTSGRYGWIQFKR